MVVAYALLWCLSPGCAAIDDHGQQSANPPLRVVVGPVVLEEPIPNSSQIYSFSDDPTAEMESIIAAQLVDDIQVKGQMFLTTHLSQQSGMVVVHFDEVRRLLGDIAPGGTVLSAEQADTLAALTGADIVITGLIQDYGRVRWQYWTTGWLIPVRVHADMVQTRNCRGLIWSHDELVVRVPGKTLVDYPPVQQSRKEIQLEANLNRVMGQIADSIGDSLALQPCNSSGTPKKISSFTVWSVLDLLY